MSRGTISLRLRRESTQHRSVRSSFHPFVLPSIRPGNDISLRLERRGVVVSALALCLPYNSNDVYRSCYRGYTLSLFFSFFFSVQLEDAGLEDANTRESPNSSWRYPSTWTRARAHRRDDKEIHSPLPQVYKAFRRVYLSTGEIARV